MNRALDAAGVGLSTLCLVHCLALPAVAAAAPLAAKLAEAEWVHRTIVALAAPAAILAIAPTLALRPFPWALPVFASLGLAGLVSALFVHTEALETGLTTIGGVLLASAHIFNWRHTHKHAHRQQPHAP
jgi:hypothetical protein